jgi:hypothetical protein
VQCDWIVKYIFYIKATIYEKEREEGGLYDAEEALRCRSLSFVSKAYASKGTMANVMIDTGAFSRCALFI